MTSLRSAFGFQSLLGTLAGDLRTMARHLVDAVTGLGQDEAMEVVTDAYPEIAGPYLAASTDLTATWFEDQVPGTTAQPVELDSDEEMAASARWAVLQDDPAAALEGDAERRVFRTSRQTVATNAKREGVRWARHASADACGFCRMLATLGAHYKSETSAMVMSHTDAQGHNHCNCIAVPVTGDYEPPPYIEQWKRDYRAAREAGAKTPGEIANEMDYMPGGRRYNGVPPEERKRHRRRPSSETKRPAPAAPERQPTPQEVDKAARGKARTARRLLPGLEKSLADLRAKGLPEDSPQIQYHLKTIARLRRQLQRA